MIRTAASARRTVGPARELPPEPHLVAAAACGCFADLAFDAPAAAAPDEGVRAPSRPWEQSASSPGPVSILWGPERVQIYNDAYIPIAAERHPDALGQPVAQNWSDAYEAFLAPILDRVFDGQTVRIDEYAVPLRTPSGRVEQRFFTGSFQPLHDETGTVEGVFHPLCEVTGNKAAAEDQRRAEQALRESETRYRQIVEGAEDYAIVRLDDRGIITT